MALQSKGGLGYRQAIRGSRVAARHLDENEQGRPTSPTAVQWYHYPNHPGAIPGGLASNLLMSSAGADEVNK